MLTHPRVPPHRLDLKKNCIRAIQRNLSVEKGMVRNARVRVVALHRRFVRIQLINTSESHCIPLINFASHPNCPSWISNKRQFPLRRAYATTLDGCQCLTLARTVLDFRTDHGQLYTALSEVRTRRHTMCLFAEANEGQDC
ncbi:hypothetical protein DFJ58DRAFT_695725 [Suillus subalutaceus]|uniref:uncharacterized protein n=1 Tax=Suillus subalutaceus TaxID=48586 RepID=UPI001B882F59|nr:uncharacterized protein DFJ58DRAFT_695725 [Suillus subalutaceus]KAG1873565.1 hypothetical protein DFJ58DRAFT_695725 [Suillus subalutaceus]